MTLTLWVYGINPSDLDDREKEHLAVIVHETVQEEFNVHPDSVDVEGHGG